MPRLHMSAADVCGCDAEISGDEDSEDMPTSTFAQGGGIASFALAKSARTKSLVSL